MDVAPATVIVIVFAGIPFAYLFYGIIATAIERRKERRKPQD